jgi:hypothetical protein
LFGPANVGVWRASLAVEAGEAGAALTYADQVQPRDLASHNRRAGLWLEKARAYAMLGKDADAVREVRQAERISPAQTRTNPLIRELVRDMLSRARREAGAAAVSATRWLSGRCRGRQSPAVMASSTGLSGGISGNASCRATPGWAMSRG